MSGDVSIMGASGRLEREENDAGDALAKRMGLVESVRRRARYPAGVDALSSIHGLTVYLSLYAWSATDSDIQNYNVTCGRDCM